jgi:hypothetical protein
MERLTPADAETTIGFASGLSMPISIDPLRFFDVAVFRVLTRPILSP